MKPMLAGKFDAAKQQYPVYVQPKLDGIRCCIVDGKAVTRTLKPVPSRYVRSILERHEFEGFDGELIVGSPTADDCYRQTCSGIMAEDKQPNFRFYVFDLWNNPLSYDHRRTRIYDLAGLGSGAFENYPGLVAVPSKLAGNQTELEDIEAAWVALGHEGVILRGPDSLYKFGRGTASKGDLLKLKRFTDSEAVVVGVYEELHNANEATTNALGRTERSSVQANKHGKGTLGGLEVQLLRDHAGFAAGTEFKIGTGFSAELRAELWANPPLGRIAKFRHFEVGAKDKPRHPSFLGWRDPIDMGDPA